MFIARGCVSGEIGPASDESTLLIEMAGVKGENKAENMSLIGLNGQKNGKIDSEGCPTQKRMKSWTVPSSNEAKGAVNLIRQFAERHFTEALENRDKSKELIELSLGDPTVFGNLPPDPVITKALIDAAATEQYNGYGHSKGIPSARQSVAERFSVVNEAPLTAEDVIMTCSCSGALDMAIGSLANIGQNILTPSPGFSLYRCLIGAKQIEQRLYRTLPERQWEVDIEDMERLVDRNTAAIIINNPSNPCGSVYSKKHLKDITNFAAQHQVPIISDEIYAEMVFTGCVFHSIASVATDVPVLVCGGVSKRYLIPGWKVGWILIHDPIRAFDHEVRLGLDNMAMKNLGSSTVSQAAVPDILKNVPESFHKRNISVFEENARMVSDGLQSAPGLNPVQPSGAMYMMVGIDIDRFPEFRDDVDFTKQLLIEQSVFSVPGQAVEYKNFFRIVLVMPKDKIKEACERIVEFCTAHYK